MIGYCRLCNRRFDSGVAPPEVIEHREQFEFGGLAGAMMQHLQASHKEAFQTLVLVSMKLQTVIAGYLLSPPPRVASLASVLAHADLEPARKALRLELIATLSQDDPCQVNKVKPAGLAGTPTGGGVPL